MLRLYEFEDDEEDDDEEVSETPLSVYLPVAHPTHIHLASQPCI